MSNATKRKVFTYTVLDGRTSIQKLNVLDQIRAMMKEFFTDDSKELKREDILTQETLKLEANLMDFIEKATEPIRRGEKHSVELDISSAFKSVLERVLSLEKYTRYYKITYQMPDIPYNIKYNIRVRMEVL